jgi:hypothetical protein
VLRAILIIGVPHLVPGGPIGPTNNFPGLAGPIGPTAMPLQGPVMPPPPTPPQTAPSTPPPTQQQGSSNVVTPDAPSFNEAPDNNIPIAERKRLITGLENRIASFVGKPPQTMKSKNGKFEYKSGYKYAEISAFAST